MFIGHFGLAFAAKSLTRRVSLAMLLVAAQWADLVWPVLVAFGVEEVRVEPGNTAFTPLDFVSYPYSHSLAALLVWGLIVGVVYRVVAGQRRTVWVLGSLVVSHWLLDFITHRPDMPLYPGSPRFGLGLWNSIPGTLIVEGVLYALGLWIYTRTTMPHDAVGRWGFATLAGVVVVLYLVNLVSPPPPSPMALAITAIIGATLLGVWAWWVDKHRDLREQKGA